MFNFLDALIKHKIRNVELSGGSEFIGDPESKLKTYQEQHNIKFLLHNYFPPPKNHFVLNIASENERERERSISFAKASIQLANKLGICLYTIHAGYFCNLVSDENNEYFLPTSECGWEKEVSLKHFESSVEELCEFAQLYDIKFCVENLFPASFSSNFSLLCTEEEICWALDRFLQYPNFGLLLDLGHAKISSHLLGFDLETFLTRIVEKWRQRILEIHISENDGLKDMHLLPSKDSWMLKFIKEKNLTSIPISIEARNGKFAETVDFYFHSRNILGSY